MFASANQGRGKYTCVWRALFFFYFFVSARRSVRNYLKTGRAIVLDSSFSFLIIRTHTPSPLLLLLSLPACNNDRRCQGIQRRLPHPCGGAPLPPSLPSHPRECHPVVRACKRQEQRQKGRGRIKHELRDHHILIHLSFSRSLFALSLILTSTSSSIHLPPSWCLNIPKTITTKKTKRYDIHVGSTLYSHSPCATTFSEVRATTIFQPAGSGSFLLCIQNPSFSLSLDDLA